jgi:hypothetical protein
MGQYSLFPVPTDTATPLLETPSQVQASGRAWGRALKRMGAVADLKTQQSSDGSTKPAQRDDNNLIRQVTLISNHVHVISTNQHFSFGPSAILIPATRGRERMKSGSGPRQSPRVDLPQVCQRVILIPGKVGPDLPHPHL